MDSTDQPRASRRPLRQAAVVAGVLLLLIAVIYGQTIDFEFLAYDDDIFVSNCPAVLGGISVQSIAWAFTDGPSGEWYPLAMLSHMLDCQLYGPDAWGQHLTNVLLHAATSLGLWLVLWRMTGELGPSALVAAIFAVHPQHVESVAWISERRDVLSGLLFVLTLAAYLAYVRRGRKFWRYALVVGLLALGLLAKPTLVTTAPLLLLLDYWPLGRFGAAADLPRSDQAPDRPGFGWLLWEKLPLAILAAGACAMTLRTHVPVHGAADWPARLGNAAVSCLSYLAMFFYPVDLAAVYPFPPTGQPAWKVAEAVAILSLFSIAVLVCRRRWPYLAVGWFWYLGTLVPMLGVISLARHAMADRYMYLPSIGLSIVLVWPLARFAAGWAAGRWVLAAGTVLSLLILTGLAARQTTYWRDDETLWRHALGCTVDNGHAELGLAGALVRKQDIDQAIVYYRRAQKHSRDVAPYNDLGTLYSWQGKLDEAVKQYDQALAIDPNVPITHVNLGLALAAQGHPEEAAKHFRQALAIDSRSARAHVGLAQLFLAEGKIGPAQSELEQALVIDPSPPGVHNDLAILLARQGEIDRAIAEFNMALLIDPQFADAHVNLARALAELARFDEAAMHCRAALQLDPDNRAARDLLKLMRVSRGQASPR